MTTKVSDGMTTGLVKTSNLASKAPSSKSSGDEGKVVQLDSSGGIPSAYVAAGGKLLKFATANTTAYSTTTDQIPWDNTKPQSDEGNELLTLSFTPTASDSTLVIDFSCGMASNDTAGNGVVFALFQDSDADAIAFAHTMNYSDWSESVCARWVFSASSTSARTYKIRYGAPGGRARVHGTSGQRFGGVVETRLTITEISA